MGTCEIPKKRYLPEENLPVTKKRKLNSPENGRNTKENVQPISVQNQLSRSLSVSPKTKDSSMKTENIDIDIPRSPDENTNKNKNNNYVGISTPNRSPLLNSK